MEPACFVSFPWYSILLQCDKHIMWSFPVILMRRKRVKSVVSDHVLENRAVRLVSLKDKENGKGIC